MTKYSKRGLERRRKEREGYSEFFEKHIKLIKSNNISCEECGEKLKGDVSEVAHILPKNKFKSVATNSDNIIYLCGMYSTNQCHYKFDNSSIEYVREMKIFNKIVERFNSIRNLVQEKFSWKDLERF